MGGQALEADAGAQLVGDEWPCPERRCSHTKIRGVYFYNELARWIGLHHGQDVVEGTTWKNKEICEARRVQQKFLIPEDKVLKVTDEQGIEVDEDVFPELATESMCFVISVDDVIPLAESSKNMAECSDPTEFADCSNLTEFVTLGRSDLTLLQQGEGSSSSSLTDSLSLSSSLSSLASDAGSQMNQPVMDSTCARNAMERILTSKPAGMTVIKEYEETGSLKDSTRRLMVNIIVAHMREKEGRFVNKTTKEFHALGIVSLFPSLKDPYSKKGYVSLKCNRVVK
ncbi:uncharacterized protein AB9X84_008534 [Acanthopagrus schlegelii]